MIKIVTEPQSMSRQTGPQSTGSWKQAIKIKLLRTEMTIPYMTEGRAQAQNKEFSKTKLRHEFSYIHISQKQQQQKQKNNNK